MGDNSIIDYIIVSSTKVVSHLESGWELHGSPFFSTEFTKYGEARQAMIKRISKIDQEIINLHDGKYDSFFKSADDLFKSWENQDN